VDAPIVRFRTSLRTIAVAGSLIAGVIAAACSESRFPLGSDCLKDEDCLSGICSQQRCTAAPPYLDAEPVATDSAALTDAPGLQDSSIEAAGDARTDGPADAQTTSEGGAGTDSAPESSTPDAPADVRAGG
jgi:hypothetical protein